MSYAQHRRIIDVDSHVIGLGDFLSKAATPKDLPLLPDMSEQQDLAMSAEGITRGKELLAKRQQDPRVMAGMLGLSE